jgi:hypothetical protein
MLMDETVKQTALSQMFLKRLWRFNDMCRPGLLEKVAQLESALAVQEIL